MKSIIINKEPFYYEEEWLTHENLKPISKEAAIKVLSLSQRLCNERGLKIILFWGTLLGAIREKGLILGDEDVDVVVLDEKKFIESIPYFVQNGLKLIRAQDTLYSFRVDNDGFIDFYIARPAKNTIWYFGCLNLRGHILPKWVFSELTIINFLGIKCHCPLQAERTLELLYGKNWKTPIKGARSQGEIKSAYYWHKYTKLIKLSIQKCIGWYSWRHIVKKQMYS